MQPNVRNRERGRNLILNIYKILSGDLTSLFFSFLSFVCREIDVYEYLNKYILFFVFLSAVRVKYEKRGLLSGRNLIFLYLQAEPSRDHTCIYDGQVLVLFRVRQKQACQWETTINNRIYPSKEERFEKTNKMDFIFINSPYIFILIRNIANLILNLIFIGIIIKCFFYCFCISILT